MSTEEKLSATEEQHPQTRGYFDVGVDAFPVAFEFTLRCVEVPGHMLTLTLTISGPNDSEGSGSIKGGMISSHHYGYHHPPVSVALQRLFQGAKVRHRLYVTRRSRTAKRQTLPAPSRLCRPIV